MQAEALRFISARGLTAADGAALEITPLAGGLESSVARVALCAAHAGLQPELREFVIKELRGPQRRERTIYAELWQSQAEPPAARLLGAESSEEADYLFLETMQPVATWPWTEFQRCAAVCRTLAALHRGGIPQAPVFRQWDYEQELAASAWQTLELAATARDREGRRIWKRLGDLERVVRSLALLRAVVLESAPSLVHGDVHPGNVILCRRGDAECVVLIDWARARIGSPLEDLVSWLHSLGCWEPEGRRRHDALTRVYLAARGMPPWITPGFRRRCWFASASNALAGAARYHLSVLADPASTAGRCFNSGLALGAWQRVIRRAASLLPPRSLVE